MTKVIYLSTIRGNAKNKDIIYKRKLTGSVLLIMSSRVALVATIKKFNLERRCRDEIWKSNERG
jgi:hypothetical protein